jgi:hypothetical protein
MDGVINKWKGIVEEERSIKRESRESSVNRSRDEDRATKQISLRDSSLGKSNGKKGKRAEKQ